MFFYVSLGLFLKCLCARLESNTHSWFYFVIFWFMLSQCAACRICHLFVHTWMLICVSTQVFPVMAIRPLVRRLAHARSHTHADTSTCTHTHTHISKPNRLSCIIVWEKKNPDIKENGGREGGRWGQQFSFCKPGVHHWKCTWKEERLSSREEGRLCEAGALTGNRERHSVNGDQEKDKEHIITLFIHEIWFTPTINTVIC